MMVSMIKPTPKAILATLVATGLAVVAVATSVQANVPAAAPMATATAITAAPLVTLQCGAPSTNAIGFTPALTLVTQSTLVDRTTAYRNCSAPSVPAIRSGYEHRSFTIPDDCIIMLTATGNANFTITWNNSQTSNLFVSRSATLSGNTLTVVYTGTVNAGLFLGKSVRQIFKADATELNQCLAGTGPLPFLIHDVTLTIF
jgi:hypothetical protein